jgi:proteasome alpha subunit
MSLPFYVSPEQVMQDKAEYARKGIGRGKSSVVMECADGVLLMAENPSSLSKIGEIYDRIAFSGVGKFSEFDQLRKIGVRYADVKGYSYSREDVRVKALANAYSQAIGDAFTRELKPLEVEIIVAEVGDDRLAGHEKNEIYRVQFDGSISDHENYCVIGGATEDLIAYLDSHYRPNLPLGESVDLGRSALQRASDGHAQVDPDNLEVCVLERGRVGRKFHRLPSDRIRELLGAQG